MTTPPAHAAQTVDVSRDAVEAVVRRGDEFFRYHENRDKAIAMLRALLDAKEKAEQDNARLRQAIERKDAMLSFISTFADITDQQASDISEAIAYTGNDDTGG